MLNENEIKVILQFLDRVPITGHNERQSMNIVVENLSNMLKQPDDEYIEELKARMQQDFMANG